MLKRFYALNLFKSKISLFISSLDPFLESSFSHNCLWYSSSFLTVFPSSDDFVFDDECFKFALRARLLASPPIGVCSCCGYSELDAYHSLNCRVTSKLRTNRHDAVKDLLAANLSEAIVEKPFVFGAKELVLDIVCEKIGIDVTVVGGHGHSPEVDFAHGFNVKMRKYRCLVPGFLSCVVPLVFSVSGGLFKSTIDRLKSLGLSNWCETISCLLVKWGFKCNVGYWKVVGLKRGLA
ncbi:hypothetical protein RCL1_002790 [Eukaryota sp. TZLM3-RCL]